MANTAGRVAIVRSIYARKLTHFTRPLGLAVTPVIKENLVNTVEYPGRHPQGHIQVSARERSLLMGG